MSLKNNLLFVLHELESDRQENPSVLRNCVAFVKSAKGLIREENTPDHLCCFFLPVHIATKSCYLVHHKKAHDWIPPGGHMERDEENPIQTIRREIQEELGYSLMNETIKLAGVSIKKIHSPIHPCKTHYDLWYTIAFEKRSDFNYSHEEFYDAGWFGIKEALEKMKDMNFLPVLKKIAGKL